jgi:hypothetical protein
MSVREELVETYEAVDESGRRHTIRVYARWLRTDSLDGPEETETGVKSYRMASGDAVNLNSDGTLEEVGTGRRMRRVDS